MARAGSTGAAVALAALLVVALLGGCGAPVDKPAEDSADSATPAATTPTENTGPEVAEDQRFAFDDLAEFPDGLSIEMAGALATKAEATHRGAEDTNGEMVIVSIVIQNNTDTPYDATAVRVGATYADGTQAAPIVDETKELTGGFSGPIGVEEEGVATLGFAVPFRELAAVTFVVDPADDDHEAVSFTGTVERG